MTEPAIEVYSPNPDETRMQLRYGVDQADACWDFALGPQRKRIWERLREIDTRMLRLHFKDEVATYMVSEIDEGTENRAVESACDGTVILDCSMAVVTTLENNEHGPEDELA